MRANAKEISDSVKQSLKGQSNESCPIHFFHNSNQLTNWPLTSDQWVKIFSILVKNSPVIQIFPSPRLSYPGKSISPGLSYPGESVFLN